LIGKKEKDLKNFLIICNIICGVFCVILFVGASFTTIDAGHVGIPVLFGKVKEHNLSPGFHFVNPFYKIKQMSVRTETHTMNAGQESISVLSKNGLKMPMDTTIVYRLTPKNANWVYENFGEDYVVKIIAPAARTAVRLAASKFTDQECYAEKREELASEITTQLQKALSDIVSQYDNPPKDFISMSPVQIRNIELPDKVRIAIEEKLKADQESQQMDFRITKERKEAERKKIEAEGIQAFQDIVRLGIDEQLLIWKGIEATQELAESPNTKIIIFGDIKSGGLPHILAGMEAALDNKKK
jgi:regulator of protease activity HflC (stomatin/prohibitin superfamily)